MRVLTIISGVLMMVVGAFCFANMGQTFLTMAFIIGTVMVLSGVIHALAYLIGRGMHNKGDNNGWILIDALLTLLLGILVLCNQIVVDLAIPMVFGMWVLVSGLLRIEAATHINRENKNSNFKAALITGIITVAVGLFGFINPIVAWVSIVFLLGMFMMIQGVNSLELGINMPHEKKNYIKVYKRKRDVVKIDDEVDENPDAIAERFVAQAEQAKQEREVELIEKIATENLSAAVHDVKK